MTTQDAKKIIHDPYKPFVLALISFVNLTDNELKILVLRHMRGHTQEKVAEELDFSVNGIQNIEKTALEKCCKAWSRMAVVKEYLKNLA